MPSKKAIVIGAGIVGLAMARSLAKKNYQVTVFERHEKAVSASIRNFGMVWPIGQTNGRQYERALLSRHIWKEICDEAGLWYDEVGSLHLAYHDLEWEVIQEVAEANRHIRPFQAISAAEALHRSPAAQSKNLKGALWSPDELIIESRDAIEKLPMYLAARYGIRFHFNTAIVEIDYPTVRSGRNSWSADEIFVCSGTEYETLYPEIFATNNLTKCKLQMMRLIAQSENWRIGPALCGGLSLIHYKGFEVAPSLPKLKHYYQTTLPDYLKWGIHVMVSQNAEGELTIGDSHEYGLVFDPFDKQFINQLIMDYLQQFVKFKNWQLIQSWNGIYAKKTDGKTDFIYSPEPGVTIVNGLGGAGMTLSFGLAEEIVQESQKVEL